jgi:lipid-A-disaccharide synthase
MKEILIVSGESSGEFYGAGLVKELKKISPDLKFFGVGGKEMRDEGVELIFGIEQLSIIGILEVIPHLLRLSRIKKEILLQTEKRKPMCAILIDSPDFNLRLAKELYKINIPVIYFISPTIWAWRRGRIKTIKRYVSLLLIIFPFEKDIYEGSGVNYIFIGHPLKDRVKIEMGKEGLRKSLGLENGLPVISLLPGSRKSEIKNHLPVLIDSLKELRKKIDFKAFLIKAPGISEDFVKRYVGDFEIDIVQDDRFKIMACSDIALASCGTSNLELLLLGVPFIAFYKIFPLSYLIVKSMAKVRHASIVNILAGKELIPELLQSKFNKKNVIEKVLFLLNSQNKRDEIRKEFEFIKASLGEGDALSKGAKAIVEFLGIK